MAGDKRKQSLYFPVETIQEIEAEARRLDRSFSWVVQHAWRHGKEAVRKIPSLIGVSG